MSGPYKFIGGGITLAQVQALIDAAIAAVIGTATALGDTLGELQASIALKVDRAGDTMTGRLRIEPPVNSLTRGIDIEQTGPTAGGIEATDVTFNQILIDTEAVEMACVASVSENVVGLKVAMTTNGSDAKGQRAAFVGQSFVAAATSALNPLKIYSGIASIFSSNANDDGTNTSSGAQGRGIGHNANAILDNGATNWFSLDGEEINMAVRTGASVRIHRGLAIIQYGDHAVSGAEIDAGLVFVNQVGAVGWAGDGIRFDSSQSGSGQLFKSTAYLMRTAGAETITGGLDFTSFTFTGSAIATPGFRVRAGGQVIVDPSLSSYTPSFLADLFSGVRQSGVIARLRGYGGTASYIGERANGTIASPTSPLSGENMMAFDGAGWDGSAFVVGGRAAFGANQNWSSGVNGTFFNVALTADGSTGVINSLTVRTTGSSQNNNLFVDSNGVLRCRAYTVATLPAATNAGQRAYVTNSNATLAAGIGAIVAGGGTDVVPVFSDGTNWRIG